MDDIAAKARVSKQTIYTHFTGKEELFADLVMAGSLESRLRQLARRYLGFVAHPDGLRLRRLIIGAASRFLDLAREYCEHVPGAAPSARSQIRSRTCMIVAGHAWTIRCWPRSILRG